jgi:hypothetical protein
LSASPSSDSPTPCKQANNDQSSLSSSPKQVNSEADVLNDFVSVIEAEMKEAMIRFDVFSSKVIVL